MLMDILAMIVIGVLAYRIYKKQDVKPIKWKAFIVIIIGLFSFSITIPAFDTFVKIPILPLGVWILYFIYRNKVEKWAKYRRFAWLGFISNFIFLAAALLSFPLQNTLYPENELSTYMASVKEAEIVSTHPSAKKVQLNKKSLESQLNSMRKDSIPSEEWYYNTVVNVEPEDRKERFPYQLTGTEAKWGSGTSAVIYVEEDGKGLLVWTPTKQLYYRADSSILEGGR
jgi:glucan phosphoethanolaminetransferase (alkaline phosphatase superfamily)